MYLYSNPMFFATDFQGYSMVAVVLTRCALHLYLIFVLCSYFFCLSGTWMRRAFLALLRAARKGQSESKCNVIPVRIVKAYKSMVRIQVSFRDR